MARPDPGRHAGRAGRAPGRGWEALAAAALLNAALVLVLDEITVHHAAAPPPAGGATAAPPPEVATGASSAAAISLVSGSPPALTLEAVLGVNDVASWDGGGPARPRAADLPGERAADRGGGDVGGTATWTGRRDRARDAALRQRLWTSPDAYRAPRQVTARRAASPEAITRGDAALGDRAPARQARDGAAVPSRGDALGAGVPGLPLVAAVDAPDATAGVPGATTPARRDGATVATREAAFVDRGASAVDVATRGPTADDRSVAAASNQRRPDPFDLTPPRSGGAHDGEGVAGAPAPGAVADGWGRGTAATRAPAAGGGDAATYASRQDPYFIELFARLDRTVVYPRELAMRLISGRVVAVVTLRADGAMTRIAVHAGSPHGEFDEALTAALRRVGRLPPVPDPVLQGRRELRVMIPYTFRRPMIQ